MLTFDYRKVFFYQNSENNCPVADFIDNLSSKQAKKIHWVIRLIRQNEIIPSLYLKKLNSTNEIWEIRIQSGGNIFRILGFFDKRNFIATNIFCKKSQKTPISEIFLAEQRRIEYNKYIGINYDGFRTIH